MWKQTDKMFLTALFPLLVVTDAAYHLRNDTLNWTSAQSSCTLLGKSAFCDNETCDIKRSGLGEKALDAWIGSYYVKSDWISYLGCHSSTEMNVSEANKIDDNSVEKCYLSCKDKIDPQRQLFALQENYCWCNFSSKYPANKELTCNKKCKQTDDHCGTIVQNIAGITNVHFVSLYKVNAANLIKSDINKDCKVMINGTVTSDSCSTLHDVICKNGDSTSTSNASSLYSVLNQKATWNEARNLCRLNFSSGRLIIKDEFNASLINVDQTTAFWIGEFRLDQMQWLQDQTTLPDPTWCGGIFVNNTIAIFKKNACEKKKYALCVAKENPTSIAPVVSTRQKSNTIQTARMSESPVSEKTESSTLKMKVKTTIKDQSLTSVQTKTSVSNDSKEVIDLGKTESSTAMTNLNTSTGGQSLNPSQSKTDNSSDSKEIFIFIGLGLAFLVLLCIVAVVLILRKKKTKQMLKTETNNSHGGDLPMIEGRALLLHQSEFNENNPTKHNTDENGMSLVENKLDNTYGEGDINGEYNHLQFQRSRRDSSDPKDDTYDHATGMLDDDLYSKTNMTDGLKGSTSLEDDTYNHVFDLLDDIYSKSNLPITFDDLVLDTQYDHTTDVTKDTNVDDIRTDNAESDKHEELEDSFHAHCQSSTDKTEEPTNSVKEEINGAH